MAHDKLQYDYNSIVKMEYLYNVCTGYNVLSIVSVE
jgi:hypothetical protein